MTLSPDDRIAPTAPRPLQRDPIALAVPAAMGFAILLVAPIAVFVADSFLTARL